MSRSVMHLSDIFGALILLVWIVAASVVALYSAYLLLRLFHHRYDDDSRAVPVQSFFAAITTIWALVFGFVAADIWATNSNAAEAAVEERAALIRLSGMAQYEALDMPDLESALHYYVVAVAQSEWDTASNRRAAPEVDGALQSIRLSLLAADEAGVSPVLLGKMIADFDELQDARTRRLAIGKGTIQVLKWALVVMLALMSLVAIAFVHRDKPRAGRAALTIFTVAASSAIWLVLLHASPYSGSVRIVSSAIAF
ncbi:MAG: hypothetical protein JJU15_12870 [Pararhodobacter sp.]|nr:hypothetical protein [Pararhodobacter sp.]